MEWSVGQLFALLICSLTAGTLGWFIREQYGKNR
jgi:hypothetical protein